MESPCFVVSFIEVLLFLFFFVFVLSDGKKKKKKIITRIVRNWNGGERGERRENKGRRRE